MNIRSTLVSAIVVGGLMAGVGATPAMAAPRPVASSVVAPLATTSSTASVARGGHETHRAMTGQVAVPVAEVRIIPALVVAAFVAAARAVPGLLVLLRPFAARGASAFFAAVKKYGPGTVAGTISGVASSTIFYMIKNALHW